MKTNEEILKGIKCCLHRCYTLCEKCPYQEYKGCKAILLHDVVEHFTSLELVRDAIPTVAQAGEKVGSEKAWEVARFNNLNGFRNIAAGTELLFPPLRKS